MTCSRDGSTMREDMDFLRDAIKEGVEVRRWVCTYGHSAYSPTTPEQRGWTPRERGGASRTCSKCGESLPVGSHDYFCDGCVKVRSRPCQVCGKPTPRGRNTCSTLCLHALNASTGRRALEELHKRKKVKSPRETRTADEILKDYWKRSA